MRGVEYKLVKARDFEVIVRSDNGFINYTKLCQQINDGKKPFYKVKDTQTFKYLCIQMENHDQLICRSCSDVSLYEEIKSRIEMTEEGNSTPEIARISGTYMPRYLLDYVIMTCDISYYKLIHELMDSIDQVAQERQRSFIEELQSNISEQNRKLERKRAKITRLDQLCNELRESNTNLANQMNEVREQNNQLLEDNRHTHQQLHQANHKLDSLGHQINGLTNSFTSNFSEMNVTTGTAEYTYLLLTRQALTNGARRNGKIAADF